MTYGKRLIIGLGQFLNVVLGGLAPTFTFDWRF